MYQYHVHGLTLRSDLPMPGLAPDRGEPDIFLRRGLRTTSGVEPSSPQQEACLTWGPWAAIRVRAGQEISYEAPAWTEEGWLRECLLGPALGVLLCQRGLLVLHASAVDVGGEAVLFVGRKGQGKSTTAAALHGRGHPLLADDVVALDVSDPSRPLLVPGLLQIKLWPDAVEAVRAPSAELSRFDRHSEKQVWRLRNEKQREPLPVRQLYTLAQGPAHRIESLSQKEALVQVVQNLYAQRFLGPSSVTAEQFRACVAFTRAVPAARFTRTPSLALLSEALDLVEDRLGAGARQAQVRMSGRIHVES